MCMFVQYCFFVDVHQISTVENPAICKEEEGEKYSENSKDRWYDEIDDISEPPDAGEMVDDQSDISDYEETYIKKKKKKVCQRKQMDEFFIKTLFSIWFN